MSVESKILMLDSKVMTMESNVMSVSSCTQRRGGAEPPSGVERVHDSEPPGVSSRSRYRPERGGVNADIVEL
jgi:hypothetical protein